MNPNDLGPMQAVIPGNSYYTVMSPEQMKLLQELAVLIRLQTEHVLNPPPEPPDPPPTEAQQQAAEERRLWDLEYKAGFRRSRELTERQTVIMERQAVALENIAGAFERLLLLEGQRFP